MNYAQQFDRLDVREQENLALLVREKKYKLLYRQLHFKISIFAFQCTCLSIDRRVHLEWNIALCFYTLVQLKNHLRVVE